MMEDGEVPEGWEMARMGEVFEINPGKPRLETLPGWAPVSFVPMAAVDERSGAITGAEDRPLDEVRKGYTAFRDDDVIVAKITPCMENGKAAIARGLSNGLGFGSSEFHVLRPTAAVLPEYAFHYIRQNSFRRAAEPEMTGSVGQKRVPASYLEGVQVPLPPLAEQRRIVAKLDEVLSQLNAAREQLERVSAILQRFRQSVLAAACSGRLTEGWRDDGFHAKAQLAIAANDIGVPSSWMITSLGACSELITSGSRGWARFYSESGATFIRAQNISGDVLDLSDVAFVQLSDRTEGQRTRVQTGDLLVTITGANVTKSALVQVDLKDVYVSQHVALVRLSDPRYAPFIFHWIVSLAHGRAHLLDAAYGAGKPGLNLANLREMPIGLPPLAEQNEIARRVDRIFAWADAVEKRVDHARARIEKLTQAVLSKAFRGELVPKEAELARRQGCEYEPASALLERVRANRRDPRSLKRGAGRPRGRDANLTLPGLSRDPAS